MRQKNRLAVHHSELNGELVWILSTFWFIRNENDENKFRHFFGYDINDKQYNEEKRKGRHMTALKRLLTIRGYLNCNIVINKMLQNRLNRLTFDRRSIIMKFVILYHFAAMNICESEVT